MFVTLGPRASAFSQRTDLSSGERRPNKGVTNCDDGDFTAASKDPLSAVDLGLDPKQQAQAHKYLAFMRCATCQQVECRNHFRQALEADPQFSARSRRGR